MNLPTAHRSANVAALALAALTLGAGPGSCVGSGPEPVLSGVPVQRGDLQISVVQRGNLEAKDAVSVQSELERRTTVLYLIPEGTQVSEGDLLVELDVSDLEERQVTQEISVENAAAAHTKARQGYAIQKSENESSIDAAQNAVEFAEMDLQKYREGDWPQQLQVAAEEIVLAEEEQARAEERLNWSTDLAERGFLTRTELEGDRLALNRSEILFKQSKRRRELLIEYDNPRQLKQLEADRTEAVRELERTKMRAEARLVDLGAAMSTSERKLELERENLAKTLAQIQKARIVSPVAGMVVYTREGRGRWGSSEPMQEGAEVRERQEILTIPTANGMVAEVSVHESVLKRIVPGLPCLITVNALPGLELVGEVAFVAPLPDQNSWWANPNARLFRTEVTIEASHPDMRPGMSCSIEFLIDDVEDALYVPLQAVNLDHGRTLCFVEPMGGGAEPEPRDVEVGRSNDKYVEITSGLREGELVLMSPPPGFMSQGDDAEEGRRDERGSGERRRPDRGSDRVKSDRAEKGSDGRAGDRADGHSSPVAEGSSDAEHGSAHVPGGSEGPEGSSAGEVGSEQVSGSRHGAQGTGSHGGAGASE